MDRLSKNEMMVILDEQLQNAQNIQKKIIPKPQAFNSDYYHFYAYLKPFRRVGGDFYDFHMLDGDQVSLILADTTGHGLDAAMITSMVKLIYTYAMKDPVTRDSPSQLLRQLDQDIEMQLTSSFFSAFALKLDPHRNELLFGNAGHPSGIVIRKDLEFMNPTLPLIGIHQIMTMLSYKDVKMPFSRGDKLLLYTDGLPEAVNPDNEPFGLSRITAIIRKYQDMPVTTLCQQILQSFFEFTEDTNVADDVCLLGLEYDAID